VQLEQGEERHRLGQAVLAPEGVVEVEVAAAPREKLAKHAQPALQGNGRPYVADVGRLGDPQQAPDRLA
jgi:hypothetical protein